MKINLLKGLVYPTGRLLPLSQGQLAIVNDEDFEELSKHKWSAYWDKKAKAFYAGRHLNEEIGRPVQYLHRQVLNLQPRGGGCVDHINHNTLDNRRSNLRLTTNRGNHENRKKHSIHGIGIRKLDSGRFVARTWVGKKNVYIGSFDTKEEAVSARKLFMETI